MLKFPTNARESGGSGNEEADIFIFTIPYY